MINLTPELLTEKIEDIVWQNDINYIDAVVYFCEKNNIEIELLSSILPAPLKCKLEENARGLRLFKKKYNKMKTLPI